MTFHKSTGYKHEGEIAPGIDWFNFCVPKDGFSHDMLKRPGESWYEGGRYMHTSSIAYLLTDEKSLLFDTGILRDNEIGDVVGSVLGDRPLDYLVISHPDVDHTSSLTSVIEQFPEATLIAPKYGADPELYLLGDATRVREGDTISLGDLQIDFADARFVDSAMTIWMRERTRGTLFTVDWLSYFHYDNECSRYGEDIGIDAVSERQRYIVGHKYNWLPFADVEKIEREIKYMMDEYDPRILAPAHAPPIRGRENVKRCLTNWQAIVAEQSDQLIGDFVA
jgi:flavorubredoxin